jgi:hypothetical protein
VQGKSAHTPSSRRGFVRPKHSLRPSIGGTGPDARRASAWAVMNTGDRGGRKGCCIYAPASYGLILPDFSADTANPPPSISDAPLTVVGEIPAFCALQILHHFSSLNSYSISYSPDHRNSTLSDGRARRKILLDSLNTLIYPCALIRDIVLHGYTCLFIKFL